MRPTPRQIIAFVADRLDTTSADILGPSRRRMHARPRQLVAYVLKNRPGYGGMKISYPQVGRILGGRDHSTIIHACKEFPKYAKRDEYLMQAYLETHAFAMGLENDE